MKLRYTVAVVMLAWLIILWPTVAVADAGVPLVAIFLPPLWLGLVPIIFIEAFVNCRLLLIPFRRTLLPATLGNLASAIVGIPLTWVFLAAFEIFFGSHFPPNLLGSTGAKVLSVTIGAPWLIPYEPDLWWMVPVALAFLRFLASPCQF